MHAEPSKAARLERGDFRAELKPMLRLALPVALGELAWMAMGVADTMMVGRVSAPDLGAMSVGRVLFMGIGVFGIGLLLGLDTLVSRAFGAGDRAGCNTSLVQGTYLALAISPPLMALYAAARYSLPRFGVEPEVMAAADGYIRAIGWTMLPLLLYTAFRRYLQAVNLVRPVMFALVSANLVNIVANWVLIFGHWGFPAMGAEGAGWATLIAIGYMAGYLLLAISLNHRSGWSQGVRLDPTPDLATLFRLVRLGLPAALQLTLEVGVFATVTVLASRLAAESLAAHQIAITVASVTYMVPLGISSAGAVRVGQELGRGQPRRSAVAGWTAIGLAGGVMLVAAALLFALPRPLMRAFTTDDAVVAIGAPLLLVAAVFQFFDGIAVTAIGALRGAGDTRTPMIVTLAGYWLLALPLSVFLGFRLGMGILGMWIALCVGLVLVACFVLWAWSRRASRFSSLLPSDRP